MINPYTFYQQFANQNLSALYANYIFTSSKMPHNPIYQNSTNINSIISYAVSVDFKKFQTSFQDLQNKKQSLSVQLPSEQVTKTVCEEVAEKNEKKIKKNLNSKTEQVDRLPTIQFSDLSEKSDKEEQKSKALTLDESSEKIQFEDCSIKENKNIDKKLKKSLKSQKLREVPIVDLIEFAFIRKDALDRVEIQKRRNSLLERQVENWNEVQKSRRNEKLQLRRIKY